MPLTGVYYCLTMSKYRGLWLLTGDSCLQVPASHSQILAFQSGNLMLLLRIVCLYR